LRLPSKELDFDIYILSERELPFGDEFLAVEVKG